MSNIVIIGSGPAGVSAALYAARAGVQTTVLTKQASVRHSGYHHSEPYSTTAQQVSLCSRSLGRTLA